MWQWWKRAGGEIDAEMQKEIAGKRKVLKRKPADIDFQTRKEAKAAGMKHGPLRTKKLQQLKADLGHTDSEFGRSARATQPTPGVSDTRSTLNRG